MTDVDSDAATGTPRVLFAGGGTGGHLFPGIAVARALVRRHRRAHVVFVGTGRGIEARALALEGFRFEPIRSLGLMGKSPRAIARTVALAPLTLFDAARVLRRTRPDLVIGLGGYSAGPVVFLAALTGGSTMLMEQNAVPGMTNRMLGPFVQAAAVSFETTAARFGAKAFVSGNPVRESFFDLARVDRDSRTGPPTVLVLGGSQGAHKLNLALVAVAKTLAGMPGGIRIIHQTGERDRDWVRDAYRRAGLNARVEAFFETMHEEMRAADVVVCRAGATTLAEVAAAGLPAVIVPLPTAANDHQRRNAAALAAAGAAEVVEESDLERQLVPRLVALAGDRSRRAAMSAAAAGMAKPDAADRVLQRAEELMAGGGTVAGRGEL
ncbi:MAG: undecaprenyldiphospho-muramoylpentapeptide beta-N-acetylglucosaminyltransferase [Acidobacteria bacterium]|nr:undecaprenyldiphospho-muramoylpentapeptide beta-N-acetylglucosaminyltransferase [Acidobacteriota bacterium]